MVAIRSGETGCRFSFLVRPKVFVLRILYFHTHNSADVVVPLKNDNVIQLSIALGCGAAVLQTDLFLVALHGCSISFLVTAILS